MTKVFAIASFGGHWKQLKLLSQVLDHHDVIYITNQDFKGDRYKKISDVNRDSYFMMLVCFLQLLVLFIKHRPTHVVSTGALPGLIGILIGRIFLCKTLWIDSMANAEELSFSGKIAKKIAHVCLSQWQEVASSEGVGYEGRVL
jgi:hypothetical protein